MTSNKPQTDCTELGTNLLQEELQQSIATNQNQSQSAAANGTAGTLPSLGFAHTQPAKRRPRVPTHENPLEAARRWHCTQSRQYSQLTKTSLQQLHVNAQPLGLAQESTCSSTQLQNATCWGSPKQLGAPPRQSSRQPGLAQIANWELHPVLQTKLQTCRRRHVSGST